MHSSHPASLSLSQRAQQSGGQPINELMHRALSNPGLISLAAGFVDPHTLPVELTRRAAEKVLSQPAQGRQALQYGSALGFPPLREQLAARQQAADGLPSGQAPAVEEILITAGSNELLHLLVDTLCDPGDIVLCAAPTYFVFLGILRNLGVRAVGIASDAHGLCPTALEETLRRLEKSGELPRVKALYVVSYFDNPASTTLAAERRPQLVELARRYSRPGHPLWIIEDAAYRELRYDGPDVPSLWSHDALRDTVIYTSTFSKPFAPGLRVGWGVLPRRLMQAVVDQKGNIDFGSPNFSQELISTVLHEGWFEPHVAELRQAYAQKRNAMLDAAEAHLRSIPGAAWQRPDGGLYVWLTLPAALDTRLDGTVFEEVLRENVIYVPGGICYAPEGAPVCHSQMRLSYGVQTPARIQEGIAALARAVRRVL